MFTENIDLINYFKFDGMFTGSAIAHAHSNPFSSTYLFNIPKYDKDILSMTVSNTINVIFLNNQIIDYRARHMLDNTAYVYYDTITITTENTLRIYAKTNDACIPNVFAGYYEKNFYELKHTLYDGTIVDKICGLTFYIE